MRAINPLLFELIKAGRVALLGVGCAAPLISENKDYIFLDVLHCHWGDVALLFAIPLNIFANGTEQ